MAPFVFSAQNDLRHAPHLLFSPEPTGRYILLRFREAQGR